MKKTRLIFLIAILSACNNINDKKSISKSLTSSNQLKILDKDSNKKLTKKDSIKNMSKDERVKGNSSGLLIGIWSSVGEDNAAFDIRKSNIFYPDADKLYKYKVIADSIKIFYEDSIESFGYKLFGNDTLTLTGIYGASKYYRLKK